MKNNKDLLKEVQCKLATELLFKNCISNIYVLVNDGAVILSGSFDNIKLKKLAQKIVSAIPGVNILIEGLRVESIQSQPEGVQIDWAVRNMALMQ